MTEIEARERPDPIPAMILSVMSIAKRYHEEKMRHEYGVWINKKRAEARPLQNYGKAPAK